MGRKVALGLAAIYALGGWGVHHPPAVLAQGAASAPAQTAPSTPEAAATSSEEDWGGLPPGPGREDVFYTCQACHSLATVLQQRLSPAYWKSTVTRMIEEQGLPEPEPEEYARILNYLGTYLSPDSPQ